MPESLAKMTIKFKIQYSQRTKENTERVVLQNNR